MLIGVVGKADATERERVSERTFVRIPKSV